MTAIDQWFHACDSEDGQGLAEYALILVLIAVISIVALVFPATQISSLLSTGGNTLLDLGGSFAVAKTPASAARGSARLRCLSSLQRG